MNTLALSTDFVLRTGPFDHTGKRYETEEEGKQCRVVLFLANLLALSVQM